MWESLFCLFFALFGHQEDIFGWKPPPPTDHQVPPLEWPASSATWMYCLKFEGSSSGSSFWGDVLSPSLFFLMCPKKGEWEKVHTTRNKEQKGKELIFWPWRWHFWDFSLPTSVIRVYSLKSVHSTDSDAETEEVNIRGGVSGTWYGVRGCAKQNVQNNGNNNVFIIIPWMPTFQNKTSHPSNHTNAPHQCELKEFVQRNTRFITLFKRLRGTCTV